MPPYQFGRNFCYIHGAMCSTIFLLLLAHSTLVFTHRFYASILLQVATFFKFITSFVISGIFIHVLNISTKSVQTESLEYLVSVDYYNCSWGWPNPCKKWLNVPVTSLLCCVATMFHCCSIVLWKISTIKVGAVRGYWSVLMHEARLIWTVCQFKL